MRSLLLLLIAVIGLAIYFSEDEAPSPAKQEPACPGGVCPNPYREPTVDPSVSLDLPPGLPVTEVSLLVPTKPVTIDVPISEASRQFDEAKPLKESSDLAQGRNGWRLRLFYPQSSLQRSNEIREWFISDYWLRSFGEKFGYSPVSTESDYFLPWESRQFSRDALTLVLVNDQGKFVYKASGSNFPQSLDELRLALGEAVKPYIKHLEYLDGTPRKAPPKKTTSNSCVCSSLQGSHARVTPNSGSRRWGK